MPPSLSLRVWAETCIIGMLLWCSSCSAVLKGAASGLAAGLLHSCGPQPPFLMYCPTFFYLLYTFDTVVGDTTNLLAMSRMDGPSCGSCTCWMASDAAICFKPRINQKGWGQRNGPWPLPEKCSQIRVVSLISPFFLLSPEQEVKMIYYCCCFLPGDTDFLALGLT